MLASLRAPMGTKAAKHRRATERRIRTTALTADERAHLQAHARYEGSPHHKRDPNDFGLTPPTAPRPDKTLCDEADVCEKAIALKLFQLAINRGLASETVASSGFPKQLWAVDENGQVFEAMYGGSKVGAYHGYPIRRTDPLFDEVTVAWRGAESGGP